MKINICPHCCNTINNCVWARYCDKALQVTRKWHEDNGEWGFYYTNDHVQEYFYEKIARMIHGKQCEVKDIKLPQCVVVPIKELYPVENYDSWPYADEN